MNYFLPKGYYSRDAVNNYIDGDDGVSGFIYQPNIYKMAIDIAEKNNAKYIIDIGCGNGLKLEVVSKKHKLILIDHPNIIDNVTRKIQNAEYVRIDLDNDTPTINRDIISNSVVICSDVVEHLLHPEKLMSFLGEITAIAIAVIVSTPDRVNERGINDMGPPANPYHIREWSLDEFVRFSVGSNFLEPLMYGLTESNNVTRDKTTSFIIAGRFLSGDECNAPTLKKIKIPNDFGGITASKLKSVLHDMGQLRFDDNVWYTHDSDVKIQPLILRLGIDGHVNAADKNGFNYIGCSLVAISGKNKKIKQYGESYLLKKRIGCNQFFGYVRGDVLNAIVSGIKVEIFTYPLNLIGVFDCSTWDVKISMLLKYKTKCFGMWHENVIRNNYIENIAFSELSTS